MSKPERIGVYGGTFDPIHRTHLEIARAALSSARLDRVLFVVAACPPHKHGGHADAEDRLALVEKAVAAEPAMESSRIEMDREGPSYTVDTLRELEAQHPDAELFLILGQDSLADFPTWRNPGGILTRARLLVAPRPGCHADAAPELEGRFEMLPLKDSTVSSTEIRGRIAAGMVVSNELPPEIERMIHERDLYRADHSIERCEEFLTLLRKRLSEKKIQHCISVAGFIAFLAPWINLDREQAATAGLLHDMCRAFRGDKMLRRARSYGLPISDLQQEKPVLLHGPVAAEELRRKLGIDDEAIYDALYWHTTGRPHLGKLGQALYFADFAEATRKYAEAEAARAVLDERGFDAALLYVAEVKVGFLRLKDITDPITEDFFHWLRERD